MFNQPMHSITTADGEVGTDFVPAPAGLTAAIVTAQYRNVRRVLGPVIGYARFEGGMSEAVYADEGGVRRAAVTDADVRHESSDVVLSILTIGGSVS